MPASLIPALQQQETDQNIETATPRARSHQKSRILCKYNILAKSKEDMQLTSRNSAAPHQFCCFPLVSQYLPNNKMYTYLKATLYLWSHHSSSQGLTFLLHDVIFLCNRSKLQGSFKFIFAAVLHQKLFPNLPSLISARTPFDISPSQVPPLLNFGLFSPGAFTLYFSKMFTSYNHSCSHCFAQLQQCCKLLSSGQLR